jgi:hypothetical protein
MRADIAIVGMKEQVFLVRNGLGDGHKTQAKNGLFISDS